MKLTSMCSILLGGLVGLAGLVSILVDLFTLDIFKITLDFIVLFIGGMTMWQGLTNHMYEKMVSKRMSAEWDYKIEPLIKLITDTAGKVNALETNVLETNAKVTHTIDYVMDMQKMDASKIDIIPGASFKFVIKSMMLLVFTFSALVYVSEYPFGIVHYFVTLLYLLWWALISSEYKLWTKNEVWVVGILPVLIIPTLAMLLDTVIGINNMIGVLFLGLFVYAYIYYEWASRTKTGYGLLNIKPIAYMLKGKTRHK